MNDYGQMKGGSYGYSYRGRATLTGGREGGGKLRALDLFRAFHLASEIVGDGLAGDHLVHRFDDRVGSFRPAHVAEHHLA